MYDDLADIYDRFIDWPARLSREVPLLMERLGGAQRVADLACGTGRHALALAERGCEVVGFDLSHEALEQARAQAGALPVRFVEAGFGGMAAAGEGRFDAVICLGNSLPHLLDRRALRRTARDIAKVLRPGGRFLGHLRNLPLAMARGDHWLPLRGHTDPDGTEWVFERLYDFRPPHTVEFTFAALYRRPGEAWQRRLNQTRLRAWTLDELREAFAVVGDLSATADLQGAPFDPESSGDLWLRVERTGAPGR
ncbi:MAG: class I SAM-dependent methyltransferase [Armatimonadetes bacterium]|nr:class I SAM-dependent methyltransferase [Armatimonadota bacterium]